MQYILSEQEYRDLTAQAQLVTISKAELQKLCTKIADEMPVKWGWNGPDPKPWGCILSKDGEWYCDKCPVQQICPEPFKEWSK